MGMVVVNREKKNEFSSFSSSRLPSSSSSFTSPTHTQVFSSLMAEEWPTSPSSSSSSHSPSSTSSLSAVFIGQHHQLATAVEVLLLLQLSTAQFSCFLSPDSTITSPSLPNLLLPNSQTTTIFLPYFLPFSFFSFVLVRHTLLVVVMVLDSQIIKCHRLGGEFQLSETGKKTT